MSLRDTADALRHGSRRSRDLVQDCLAQIDRWQSTTNAFISVNREAALADADQADAELRAGRDRGLLHGVPISLKDLIDQEGEVTTAGSRSMTEVADEDAPVVTHLRAHGAVLLGRCNMHEFALGTTSEDSGFGPVRHPRDHERVAGGSSGGSAVAVAVGMSHVSIGSDTGGSIRIPSAVCGVVGLKPAWGDISLGGVVPLSPTLDCVGPIARSVEDAWWTLQALRSDEEMPACPAPVGLDDLRVGVLREFGWHRVEPAIGERVSAALEAVAREGATLTDLPLASAPTIVPTYGTIVMREAIDYHAPRLPRLGDQYTPAVRGRLQTAPRPNDEAYASALDERARIQADVARLLERVHVLALPTLAIAPPRLGQAEVTWPDGTEPTRLAMLRLTQPFNLSRHPAIALPLGNTTDGWPASLQLVGRDTTSLVAAALAIERVVALMGC